MSLAGKDMSKSFGMDHSSSYRQHDLNHTLLLTCDLVRLYMYQGHLGYSPTVHIYIKIINGP